MGKLSFGELELSILKIVKERGKVSVREVYESLGSVGSYTTIMTVMSRMAAKGDLKRKKEGKFYLYWLALQKNVPSKNILKRMQDKIFGGRPSAMVSYLLDTDQEISDQELAEIEQLIQRKRKEKNHG